LKFGISVKILKLVKITIRYMYRYYCHKKRVKLAPLVFGLGLLYVIRHFNIEQIIQ